MRLIASAEADAPAERVLARLLDTEAHERRARSRGVAVARLDGTGPPRAGAAWRVGYEMLGARRETLLRVAALDASGARLVTETAGVRGDVAIAVVALAPERSRVEVAVDLAAQGLRGRLLLGALGAARGELERRLRLGVESLAANASAR